MVGGHANANIFGELAAATRAIVHILKSQAVVEGPLDVFLAFPLPELIVPMRTALRAFKIFGCIQSPVNGDRLQRKFSLRPLLLAHWTAVLKRNCVFSHKSAINP
jgi:hypothetical protein